jgi:hypothetical protein
MVKVLPPAKNLGFYGFVIYGGCLHLQLTKSVIDGVYRFIDTIKSNCRILICAKLGYFHIF